MSRFIDPSGSPTYGLAICARCSRKFKLADLVSDPNFPALMVCREDVDDYDPYRLAPHAPDRITLPFVRPDTLVATTPAGLISEDGAQFIVSEDGLVFISLIG
jgi:hypothetical protein